MIPGSAMQQNFTINPGLIDKSASTTSKQSNAVSDWRLGMVALGRRDTRQASCPFFANAGGRPIKPVRKNVAARIAIQDLATEAIMKIRH
jgi:hypothetical protein